MKRYKSMIVPCVLAAAGAALAGYMVNPSFEEEFGPREDLTMWGDHGETFGECYQVTVGAQNAPSKARTGERVLLINVPQNTWNGIWQQLPWEENQPFAWTAYYMIRGGDLPDNVATFMKAEFFDANDGAIGEAVSEQYKADTQGRWIMATLRGTTPPGTASVRFVLIAGNNPGGPILLNHIYWDDADTSE